MGDRPVGLACIGVVIWPQSKAKFAPLHSRCRVPTPLATRLGSDQARGLHGGHQRRVREEEGIARLLRMTRVSTVLPLLFDTRAGK